MRKTLVLALLLAATAAHAQTYMHPTLPGNTVRDYSRPSIRVEQDRGSTVYTPTLPGTTVRDYSAPSTVVVPDGYGSGSSVYQTLPGTTVRDYSQPGWRIEQ